MKPKKGRTHILGIGHDCEDGHKRIAQGEGFTIAGGSAETHEQMTEIAMKANETLRRKGKTIADADPREVDDAIRKHL